MPTDLDGARSHLRVAHFTEGWLSVGIIAQVPHANVGIRRLLERHDPIASEGKQAKESTDDMLKLKGRI